ncbi:MAG: NYN domain-containing protein [Myxococcota bacterium]
MENNLAVLIDFENIAAGTEKEGLGRFDVETLIQRIKDKGRILVARSYADWGRFSRFKQSLLTANVTMMELTSHGMQDKNRADIAMVVDALELAFTRAYVDTFVVVSGDSDFTPLVLKMRELNKRVIGIGTRKSTSRLLIQACDEFMFYDSVVQPKSKRRKTAGQSDEVAAAIAVLEEAIDGLQRENPDPPLASVVKSAVLRKLPDFNESDLGFSSFARFLEAAEETGVVRIIRDNKSGGYRVDTAEEKERPATEEVASDDTASGDWDDPYMPKGTEAWQEVLERANLTIMSGPTRMATLEALTSVVAERNKKRRKTTAQFVREDVKKKLRRTHPDLPAGLLKELLDALMAAGELIHRDGTAIRSGTAPFTLQKDAEELNESVVRLYLAHLREAGCDLTDTRLLADLMYGDADRRREIEETLAYLLTEGENGAQLDDLDLDDLLVPAGTKSIDVDAAPRERDRGRHEDRDLASEPIPVDEDGLLLETPTKKKRVRKTTKAEPVEAAQGSLPVAADEAPKKSTRSRSRKKKSDDDGGDLSDLDALLEPQP